MYVGMGNDRANPTWGDLPPQILVAWKLRKTFFLLFSIITDNWPPWASVGLGEVSLFG
jgi:hypothetical protein